MAIDAPMPPVFEIATRFNDAVVGREAQAAAQMAKIYVGLHSEFQASIRTLLATLSDNPTKGEITRLWRALGLEGQVLSGLGTFGDDAASIITQGQAQSIQTAMRDARRLVDVGLPPGVNVSVLEAAGVGWNPGRMRHGYRTDADRAREVRAASSFRFLEDIKNEATAVMLSLQEAERDRVIQATALKKKAKTRGVRA